MADEKERTQPAISKAEMLLRPKVRERFHRGYDVMPNGCHLWRSAGLYVSLAESRAEKGINASPRRAAWFYAKGEYIEDIHRPLLATCRDERCVNVEHLYIATDETRFWAQVNKDGPIVRPEFGPCWVWTGLTMIWRKQTYGKFNVADPTRPLRSRNRLARRHIPAHRFSYELANGAIGDPMLFVCHKCDNPPCVRPDHLFLGTPQDNIDDMIAKGRHPVMAKTQTHCVRGHELAGDNLRITAKGHRVCRACHRIHAAKTRRAS